MKTSKEMADSVFQIRDAYIEKKKKKIVYIKKASYIVSVACTFTIVFLGIKYSSSIKQDIPEVNIVDNSENIEGTTVITQISSYTGQINITDTQKSTLVTKESNITAFTETTVSNSTQNTEVSSDVSIQNTSENPNLQPTTVITNEQTPTERPTEPPLSPGGTGNPGSPGAVHTVLNVSYDEAKEKFGHSIKECTGSDFLGYKVGIVSKNGNINSNESFCLDLTYNFTNGHIFIQDQDRSAGKLANPGIEQYDYLGRIFVKEESYDDEHIIIGYYPTDMDGIAYRASFPKSVDMYEIMDKIISIEI